MNIWIESLLVFAAILLILGYFQYRKSPDVISIAQEMFRPAYLVPAVISAIVYFIVKLVLSGLGAIV